MLLASPAAAQTVDPADVVDVECKFFLGTGAGLVEVVTWGPIPNDTGVVFGVPNTGKYFRCSDPPPLTVPADKFLCLKGTEKIRPNAGGYASLVHFKRGLSHTPVPGEPWPLTVNQHDYHQVNFNAPADAPYTAFPPGATLRFLFQSPVETWALVRLYGYYTPAAGKTRKTACL